MGDNAYYDGYGSRGPKEGRRRGGLRLLDALLTLCSLAVGERPDWWGAVKLFSMLLCGCIFGSIGVNVKRKG